MNTEAFELMKPSRLNTRGDKKDRKPKHKRMEAYKRSKVKSIKEI